MSAALIRGPRVCSTRGRACEQRTRPGGPRRARAEPRVPAARSAPAAGGAGTGTGQADRRQAGRVLRRRRDAHPRPAAEALHRPRGRARPGPAGPAAGLCVSGARLPRPAGRDRGAGAEPGAADRQDRRDVGRGRRSGKTTNTSSARPASGCTWCCRARSPTSWSTRRAASRPTATAIPGAQKAPRALVRATVVERRGGDDLPTDLTSPRPLETRDRRTTSRWSPRSSAAPRGAPGRSRTAARAACPTWSRPRPGCADGTPFPTLYYLTCPRAVHECSRLESAGLMREMGARLAEDPDLRKAYEAAHEHYLRRREQVGHVAGDRRRLRRRHADPGEVPARPPRPRAGRRPGRQPVRRRDPRPGRRVVGRRPLRPPARLTTQTPKGPRQLDLELHKERRAAEGGNGGQPPDGRVRAIPASAARAAVRAQRALGVRGENPPAGPAAKRWGGELQRS